MQMKSERGAVLIIMATCLLVLTLFSAIVVDYGILWTSRAQAQNAADAAALAGAVARVFDDTTDPPASKTSGIVFDSAVKTMAFNPIWGLMPPSNTVVLDWACPSGTTKCVVVDVYRDGTHNSQTLPTVFARIVNINSQRIVAHAVAETVGANATGCLRPWFLIDRYTDTNHNGQYDAGDVYNNPGYAVPDDLGDLIDFHENHPVRLWTNRCREWRECHQGCDRALRRWLVSPWAGDPDKTWRHGGAESSWRR